MTSFKELQKRAKKLGLNLWESSGYYHLSILGNTHAYAMFPNLRSVERHLSSIRITNKLMNRVAKLIQDRRVSV